MRKSNQRLTRFREQLGLSRAEMSSLLGISQSTLSEYEHGRHNIKYNTYLKMKEHAGIDLPYSVFLNEEEEIDEVIPSLKEIRERCEMNQKQIANALGIHYRTYGRYERGETNPSLKVWVKIQELVEKLGY
jgi:transcriptional regulator with XRE-family HTH domain